MTEQTHPEQSESQDTYWVQMTVSTEVVADNLASALQKGCDVLHGLVLENRLQIHTVDAKRTGKS